MLPDEESDKLGEERRALVECGDLGGGVPLTGAAAAPL